LVSDGAVDVTWMGIGSLLFVALFLKRHQIVGQNRGLREALAVRVAQLLVTFSYGSAPLMVLFHCRCKGAYQARSMLNFHAETSCLNLADWAKQTWVA
jgi:hypothetical protein